MKEVKIEYNKILLPFCCGLTPFSNLLQLFHQARSDCGSCGLTAFSNLLQRQGKTEKPNDGCGLTSFYNLVSFLAALTFLSCCNRSENAVKPQRRQDVPSHHFCCNRLENAVKPQRLLPLITLATCCNRLENAVKPQ